MPRQARKESGTGIYHVMLRGIDSIIYAKNMIKYLEFYSNNSIFVPKL